MRRVTGMMKKESSHEACAHEKKLGKGSVKPKQLETGPDELLKMQKNYYNVLAAVANAIERQLKPEKPSLGALRFRTLKTDRRHMDQRIRDAETSKEQMQILKDLAAKCYLEARKWEAQGDADTQLKWLKLLIKLLRLSHEFMVDADLDHLEELIQEAKQNLELEKMRKVQEAQDALAKVDANLGERNV